MKDTSHAGTLAAFLTRHSFGTLVTHSDGGSMNMSHFPFIFEAGVGGANDQLIGHLPRRGAPYSDHPQGSLATFLVQGPHGYISPQVYDCPEENVPTWNYAIVHLRGRLRWIEDKASIFKILNRQVRHYETQAGTAPVAFYTADRADHLAMAQQIVGFSFSIQAVENRLKLSQTRNAQDHGAILRALRASAPTPFDLAYEMESARSESNS